VLVPRGKTESKTTLWIERKKIAEEVGGNVHVAGGDHRGIVVQKEIVTGESNLDLGSYTCIYRYFQGQCPTSLDR